MHKENMANSTNIVKIKKNISKKVLQNDYKTVTISVVR